MEIWHLKTFCVVADNLHFTKASKELRLTQSAVSHQMKNLEEELGIKLFHRDKRRISLTERGQRVLDYAKKILRQVEVMEQEIKDNKETLKGRLKIVAVPRSLTTPFSQVKQDFNLIYPEVELFFEIVNDSEAVFEYLRKGNSDIGFTTENINFRDLLPIPFGKFEMLFVVGNSHRLADRENIILRDLVGEGWILFEKGSWLRRKTDEIFSEHKFQPKKIAESNDGASIVSLIKAGAGVGFLPKWGILEELKEGKLIAVKLKKVKNFTPLNIVVAPKNRTKLVCSLIHYLLERKLEGVDIFENPTLPEHQDLL